MNQIQNKILEIFKEVSKICEKRGIDYFAIGGTCIGAVRHHGFIPWDDDLDIAVPVEQFDKLLSCLKKELPENLFVYVPKEIESYNSLFIKVMDRNTTFIEKPKVNYPDTYGGVFIDIMPISGIPETEWKKKKFIKDSQLLLRMNSMRRRHKEDNPTWYKKMAWSVLQVFPNTFFSDKWYSMIKKYPLYHSKYTGYIWSMNIPRLVFPSEWFNGYVLLDFEDTKIKCPIGYDKYLSQQFGEYMKLPPKEQQVGGHQGFVDLDTPYKEYQKKVDFVKSQLK